ncbi:MAG: DUF3108 domain-containing protein [Pseudomonadota bacterium]
MYRLAVATAMALMSVGLTSGSAVARSSAGVFDVYIGSIRGGTLSYKGTEQGGQYSTAGRAQSVGVIGALTRARYEAQSQGRLRGQTFVPSAYSEEANTGRRQSKARMSYIGGVPQVKEYEPVQGPKPYDLDPSQQGGTLDPMTAIYMVLRDQPGAQVCKMRFDMFDGRRRSRILLANAERKDNRIICTGRYERVAGFEPEEMAERQFFPIRVEYEPGTDGFYVVDRVVITTLYGRARLLRR